ncbi:AI-2E family transporter [Paludibaculum fermentans]|uniref:AI-2E family transporter n=1 Tax=Paludibaculum fermentans TaxID=1473598 RepID=A0A7S7NTA7_PALFE|nr:AI-2E family transporter [Paludibaculum fermentans]QOY89355.1 AI-2E family transporter [Paludibaculum fermentans]
MQIPVVLATVLLVMVLLYLGRVFFITLISAILLAFLLEPIVNLGMRFRIPRGASSFLACTFMLGILYLMGLGLWTQVVGLWEDLPTYSKRVTELVDAAAQQLEGVEKTAQELLVPKRLREAQPQPQPEQPKSASKKRRTTPAQPDQPPPIQEVRIRQDDSQLVAVIYSHLSDFYDAALMASFVPFLVYFLLSWRDHFRRSVLQIIATDSKRENIQRAWDGIANVARAYLVGNFLLGLVLAAASAVFFWFVKLPYWQVVGPLSGFLSLIPYLGMPLAVIPPFVAALPVYSGLSAYLIIGATTALFHLIALNLLYPKLVGARVHLNPLVVTVALMLWYLLWGGAGLILAIPITAGLKAAFENIPSLRGIGRILGD